MGPGAVLLIGSLNPQGNWISGYVYILVSILFLFFVVRSIFQNQYLCQVFDDPQTAAKAAAEVQIKASNKAIELMRSNL